MRSLGSSIVLVGLLAARASTLAATPALPNPTTPMPPWFRVDDRGRVTVTSRFGGTPPPTTNAPGITAPMIFEFGLPNATPLRRGWDPEGVPIASTEWETNGIHYTQLICVTRLGPGDPPDRGPLPTDAVLLVRIVGANRHSDYTDARAAFAIQAAERPLELAWHEGQVRATPSTASPILALVDIPPTGLRSTEGPRFRFEASMPPGTSGAMTVKVPVTAPQTPEDTERLENLDFDDERRRIRRHWTPRTAATAVEPAREFPLDWE